MRRLTKSQKRLIVEYIDETLINYFDIDACGSLYDELASINEYETLWCDSNRFGQDYIFCDNKDKFKRDHLYKNLKLMKG